MKYRDLTIGQIVEICKSQKSHCSLLKFCNKIGCIDDDDINPSKWNEGNLLDKEVGLELKNEP